MFIATRHQTPVLANGPARHLLSHEPAPHRRPNTWFVAKAAREQSLKVAVSGLGGDDLFGGYPSITVLPRWLRWLAVSDRPPALGHGHRRPAQVN